MLKFASGLQVWVKGYFGAFFRGEAAAVPQTVPPCCPVLKLVIPKVEGRYPTVGHEASNLGS